MLASLSDFENKIRLAQKLELEPGTDFVNNCIRIISAEAFVAFNTEELSWIKDNRQ